MESKYWPLRDRINKSYNTSGSDNTGVNTYSYNEIGYRGDSINDNIDILAIGCSHTEGIGVSDNETWPYFVAKELNCKHINLGYTGRSNDYIARVTALYVRQFNPKVVTVMYTYPSRREFWTEYGPQPYTINPWGYFKDHPEKYKSFTQLNTLENNIQNFIKNHLIVQLACQAAGSKLVWNGSFLDFDYSDSTRFDGDYYIEDRHATSEENKVYSSKLVGYLKDNSYI